MPSRRNDLSTRDLLHRASQIAENAFERRIGSRLGLTARQYLSFGPLPRRKACHRRQSLKQRA